MSSFSGSGEPHNKSSTTLNPEDIAQWKLALFISQDNTPKGTGKGLQPREKYTTSCRVPEIKKA